MIYMIERVMIPRDGEQGKCNLKTPDRGLERCKARHVMGPSRRLDQDEAARHLAREDTWKRVHTALLLTG